MNALENPEKINSKVIDETEIDVDVNSQDSLDLENDSEFNLQYDQPQKEGNKKIINQEEGRKAMDKILKQRTNSYSNTKRHKFTNNSENLEKINSLKICEQKEKESNFHTVRNKNTNLEQAAEFNINNKIIKGSNSQNIISKSCQTPLSQRFKEKNQDIKLIHINSDNVESDDIVNQKTLEDKETKLIEKGIFEFYKTSSYHSQFAKNNSPQVELKNQNVTKFLQKPKQSVFNKIKNNIKNQNYNRRKFIEVNFEEQGPKIVNKKFKLKQKLIGKLEEKLKQNKLERHNNIFSNIEIKKICKEISIMDESEKSKHLFEEMWKIISNNNLCIMKNFINFLFILFDLKEEINCEINLNFQKYRSNKSRIGEIRNGLLIISKDEGERIRKRFKLFLLNFIFNKQNTESKNDSNLEYKNKNTLHINQISPNVHIKKKSHSNSFFKNKDKKKSISPSEKNDKVLHKFLRIPQIKKSNKQIGPDIAKTLKEDPLINSNKSYNYTKTKHIKNHTQIFENRQLQQTNNNILIPFKESSRNSCKNANKDLNNINNPRKNNKILSKRDLNLKENKISEDHKHNVLSQSNKKFDEIKEKEGEKISKDITNQRPLIEIPEYIREEPLKSSSLVTQKESILLYIDVNIGNESFERIFFKEGDTPEKVATEFVIKHKLDNTEKEKLISLIKNNINNLLESIEEVSYEE